MKYLLLGTVLASLDCNLEVRNVLFASIHKSLVLVCISQVNNVICAMLSLLGSGLDSTILLLTLNRQILNVLR